MHCFWSLILMKPYKIYVPLLDQTLSRLELGFVRKLESKADYLREVLGVQTLLKPNDAVKSEASSVQTGVSLDLVLLASQEEINNHRGMLEKITSALNRGMDIVVSELADGVSVERVFCFETDVSKGHQVSRYPSLGEIAGDVNLKKKLWQELQPFKTNS